MINSFKTANGFTLIELMITLALLSLVLVGGFRLYFFADKTYFSGAVIADIQADIQLAMQQITNDLRLAHNVDIGKIAPTVIDDENDHYIFRDDNDRIVVRTKKGGIYSLTNKSMQDFGYDLAFSKVSGAPNMIEITITSKNPKVDYALNTKVQVLNARLDGVTGEESGDTVFFRKKFTQSEREAAQDVARNCFGRRYVYAPDAPELNQLRNFRDTKLTTNPFGRIFTKLYYTASPVLIDLVEDKPLLQRVFVNVFRGITTTVLYFS